MQAGFTLSIFASGRGVERQEVPLLFPALLLQIPWDTWPQSVLSSLIMPCLCPHSQPGLELAESRHETEPWLELKWQKTALQYSLGTLFSKCFADPKGSLNERQTLAMSLECNYPQTSHLADYHSALLRKQNFIISFHGSSWRSRLRSIYICLEKDGH